MEIVVTGSAGLVGAATVVRLAQDKNNHITAVMHDRSVTFTEPNVTVVRTELTDFSECDSLMQAKDVLVHCAARTFGAEVMSKEPLSLLMPNILMNANLLEASYKNSVGHVIFLGSTTGYPESDAAITEDMYLTGKVFSKYFVVGNAKRIAEILGSIYTDPQLKDRAINFTVLRLTNVYGPNDKFDPKKSHVLPALVKRVCERMDPFEVWGDGSEVRDFVYVSDVTEAIACVIAARPTGFVAYNVGSGDTHSINDLLAILFSLENFHPEMNYISGKPSMIPFREVNVTKINDSIGWQATTPLDVGLAHTIAWYKANY